MLSDNQKSLKEYENNEEFQYSSKSTNQVENLVTPDKTTLEKQKIKSLYCSCYRICIDTSGFY